MNAQDGIPRGESYRRDGGTLIAAERPAFSVSAYGLYCMWLLMGNAHTHTRTHIKHVVS